ncbi:MAG: tail fiber domain-containing protein [Acidobacteriota bacterium]
MIETGSATGSLRITDEGNIGLHTASPNAPLHVLAGGVSHTPSNASTVAVFQSNETETDGAIVSILAGSGSANAQLWFGDKDDDNAGRVIYRNGSDSLSFWTSGGERFVLDGDGNLCLGCMDTVGDAIRHANGAHLTAGGTWTNASSRALKQDVTGLSTDAALEALAGLEPVTFRYRAEPDETYVGFIAEEVPALVAMKDRKSLTAMDVVGVLTKVIQDQQRRFDRQEAAIVELRRQLAVLGRR